MHYWRTLKTKRVFRDWNDFFAHDDLWLINRYCLPRNVLLDLCMDLTPNLERKTSCNHAPVSVQVLSTLGFLATGTFQWHLATSDRGDSTRFVHEFPIYSRRAGTRQSRDCKAGAINFKVI